MEITAASQTPDQTYKLITGLIVPRPIAWVTTLSDDATVNLAPFSAYGLVTHSPPLLMVSVGTRDGLRKDTGRNIAVRGEFVVNVACFADVEAVHDSSAALAYGESEVAALGLETVPSRAVAPPRLARAAAGMECRLRRTVEIEGADSVMFIGEVVTFHVRDDLLRDGKIDTPALDPAARIGGPNYAGLGRFRRIDPSGGNSAARGLTWMGPGDQPPREP